MNGPPPTANARRPDGLAGTYYRELSGIATALGLPFAGEPEIRLRRDGFEIVISLNIHSGEVVGVDLSVRRDPVQTGGVWPDMELRRETPADVDAKRSGMNIEVQTGDPQFDGFVYVESKYDPTVLGPALAAPDLRRVIGELIATYGTIAVTATRVSVVTSSLGKKLLEQSAFMPLFQRTLRLAHLLKPVPQGAQTRVNDRGFLLLILSILSFFGCWLTFVPTNDYATPVSNISAFAFLGVGIVLAAIAILITRFYVRGHSRSRFYFRGTAFTLFFAIPISTLNILLLLNALLDSSTPQRVTGKVVRAAERYDDGEHICDVEIAWTDKTPAALAHSETHKLKGPSATANVGNTVEAMLKSGAFGLTWYETKPRLVAAK